LKSKSFHPDRSERLPHRAYPHGDQDLRRALCWQKAWSRSCRTGRGRDPCEHGPVHFHTDQQARALDEDFIKHVRDFSPEALAKAVASGSCEACGAGPTIARCCSQRFRSEPFGHPPLRQLRGCHRRRRQVVGYLSAALLKTLDRRIPWQIQFLKK